jgi:hypothetical protein
VVLERHEVEPDLVGQHRKLDDRLRLRARGRDEDAESQVVHGSSEAIAALLYERQRAI